MLCYRCVKKTACLVQAVSHFKRRVYLKRLRRKLFVTTKMLLKDIAPAANMGLSSPAAAAGINITL